MLRSLALDSLFVIIGPRRAEWRESSRKMTIIDEVRCPLSTTLPPQVTSY